MSYASTREAVERLCRSELDDRVLRARVIERLRYSIDFDWYVWVLTDPQTCVGSSPLAEVPEAVQLPALIRAKYLTRVHRWTSLRRGQVVSLAPVVARLADEPWDEVRRRYGVTDVMSLVLEDAYGCWAFLDLWRTGGRFRREDEDLLAALSAPMTRGLRRSVAATFDAVPRPVDGDGTGTGTGPGVMLLSSDLLPLARTPATDAVLRTLLPAPDAAPPAPPVPAAALNVGAQLLAREAGVDDHEPSARVHLAQGRWLTVRAARVDDGGGLDPTDADIAVTFEPTPSSDRATLFARASGLSRRETEVLLGLLAGADTAELASSMHLSQHTVQDHLKSVFAKTGAHGRPELVARAVGVPR